MNTTSLIILPMHVKLFLADGWATPKMKWKNQRSIERWEKRYAKIHPKQAKGIIGKYSGATIITV